MADDFSNKLSCPICLETFESPKILTCLHTFCEKCIIKHVYDEGYDSRTAETIVCPICRIPIPAPAAEQTPEDWAAKLPTNPVILSSMASEHQCKDDTVYCQPCSTDGKLNISVAYCLTCSEYLCQICYDCHKKFKVSKDHNITFQSVSENQTLRETKDKLFRCSRHKKKYTYICLEDKDLCCSKCATTDHKNCKDLILIESVAKACKDTPEAQKVTKHLFSLRNMFMTLLENRSNNFDCIQQQRTEIILEIKQLAKQVKDLTDKLETAALENLEQVYKQDAVTISNQIFECKSAIAAIETSVKMIKEAIKSDSDDTKTYMTLTRVSQQVIRYLQKHDVAQTNFKDINIQFLRNKRFEEFFQSFSSFGQVLSKDSKITGLSPDISYDKLAMILPRAQPASMVTFSSKVPDDENTCNIYSGIFLPDDRFIVCDQGNRKLKLFDKCFHCVSYMKIMDEPRFICLVDSETVAITSSGSGIYVASITNKLTKLRTIHVDGECLGIASSKQNIILDTFWKGQCSLFIYDGLYNFIKKIERPDRLTSYYNSLCLSPDGETIHCTTGNTVITVDMNGKTLTTFQCKDLKEALGITVHKSGIIYCCGLKSKSVVQITTDGRQLGVLLSSDHGLKNPYGVCLSNTNSKILVFEGKSDVVKAFRLI